MVFYILSKSAVNLCVFFVVFLQTKGVGDKIFFVGGCEFGNSNCPLITSQQNLNI